MIVDGYVRVSRVAPRKRDKRSSGAAGFISPEVQRDQIEAWAKRNDALVAHVFTELDESGGRSDRPKLMEAIARVERGDSQGIVVAYLSRFGRSLADGLNAIKRITDAGGAFITVDHGGLDLSTDTGRLVMRVMFSVAEWELDRARTNWAVARERAVARGVSPGPRRFGYRRGRDGRYAVDPDEAPLVAEVFRRRAAGARICDLRRFLDESGVPTAHGHPVWTDGTLHSMLNSRVYRGEVHHGEFSNLEAHEPLVDEETWLRAQPTTRRLPPRLSHDPPLLRGILRCAGCRRLIGASVRQVGSSYESRIYACPKARATGPCPAPTSVVDSIVEPYVEAIFWQQLAAARRTSTAKRVARLEEQVERRERELAAYRDSPRIASTIGGDRFAEGLRVRTRRVDRAQLELSRARLHDAPKLPPVPELRERWPSMTVGERGAAIAEVIECAFLSRGSKAEIEQRLFVCPRGQAPKDLPPFCPQRYFKAEPFDPTCCPPPVRLHRRKPDWGERRVREALAPQLECRDDWPSFKWFQDNGFAALYTQVERHGRTLLGRPVRPAVLPTAAGGMVRRARSRGTHGLPSRPRDLAERAPVRRGRSIEAAAGRHLVRRAAALGARTRPQAAAEPPHPAALAPCAHEGGAGPSREGAKRLALRARFQGGGSLRAVPSDPARRDARPTRRRTRPRSAGEPPPEALDRSEHQSRSRPATPRTRHLAYQTRLLRGGDRWPLQPVMEDRSGRGLGRAIRLRPAAEERERGSVRQRRATALALPFGAWICS
jgi:DNA invertase Pin-like site-specific DNA recombinase